MANTGHPKLFNPPRLELIVWCWDSPSTIFVCRNIHSKFLPLLVINSNVFAWITSSITLATSFIFHWALLEVKLCSCGFFKHLINWRLGTCNYEESQLEINCGSGSRIFVCYIERANRFIDWSRDIVEWSNKFEHILWFNSGKKHSTIRDNPKYGLSQLLNLSQQKYPNILLSLPSVEGVTVCDATI